MFKLFGDKEPVDYIMDIFDDDSFEVVFSGKINRHLFLNFFNKLRRRVPGAFKFEDLDKDSFAVSSDKLKGLLLSGFSKSLKRIYKECAVDYPGFKVVFQKVVSAKFFKKTDKYEFEVVVSGNFTYHPG